MTELNKDYLDRIVDIDTGKSYAIDHNDLLTLSAHGMVRQRDDGTYALAQEDALLRDPGSAGVGNPNAGAVLAIVRAALSARAHPTHTPTQVMKPLSSDDIEKLQYLANVSQQEAKADDQPAHIRAVYHKRAQLLFRILTALQAPPAQGEADTPHPEAQPVEQEPSMRNCACQDADCHLDRERKMVLDEERGFHCDPCIAGIVTALNDAGLKTVASCCGHGFRPGNIVLADKREIIIARDWHEARRIDRLFPVDINGSNA